MKKSLDIPKICECIWDLEKKHNLLHKEISGIKVWQSLRVPIYHKICMESGIFSQLHSSRESIVDVLKRFYYIYNVIFKDPLRGNHHKDILVFDHPRKIEVKGRYIDIYTDHLLRDSDDKDYDVIESVYLGRHLSKFERNRLYLDAFSVGSLRASLKKVPFTPDELEFIESLRAEIFEMLKVDMNLRKMFSKEIRHFKYGLSYYDKLIKKRKPKRIYLVVGYSFYKKPLIAAAKKNGVETVELQHGTIGKYHLAYSFPGEKPSSLDYFPDRFYSFGKYWSDITEIPLAKDKIEFYGFPYFSEQKERFASVKKLKMQILFISQGAIGKDLSSIAYAFAEKMPDYRVVYKLHPGEYDRWKHDYEDLVKASALPNFRVVDNNRVELYQYLAESEYLAGVFSTALYEGLAFGCKTVIIDLPGAEYMEALIDKGIVRSAGSSDELSNIIKEPFSRKFDRDYFFAEGFKKLKM